MILTPRDRDVEQHLREVIGRYDTRRRQALKTLLITQNAGVVGSDWIVFNQDALVLHPHSGPGPIKYQFPEPIKTILKELKVSFFGITAHQGQHQKGATPPDPPAATEKIPAFDAPARRDRGSCVAKTPTRHTRRVIRRY